MAGQVAYSLLVNEDVEASLLLKGGQGRTHLQEPPQQGLHAHPVPLTVHPGQHHQPYNSGQNSIELNEQAGPVSILVKLIGGMCSILISIRFPSLKTHLR